MLTRSRSALDASLHLEQHKTLESLEELRKEWSELWRHCPDATPFQSPEWLVPWWRHLGEGALRVMAFRREGRLVGFAPCFIYRAPESAIRQLMLLGSGNTDHLDLLLRPEVRHEAVSLFFDLLAEERELWDLLDLQQLPPESPLLTYPLSGWSEEAALQDVCPVLELPRSIEKLPSCVPSRMLQNLRTYGHRAERSGSVRMERADEENFDELFEALLRLHGARWQSRGEEGVLPSGSVRQFHWEVARGFLSSGVLRLYAMRIDGQIVACYYGFLHGGRAYYYLSGFDPAFEALSPGTLIIGHAIREAVREGAGKFDFLCGAEPYKYRWGAQDRPSLTRKLRPPSGAAV